MSKSLGNFFTVRDLLDQGYPGEVIRMVYLGTHYSKPMDWTKEKAEQAEATLRKWRGSTIDLETGKAEPDKRVVDFLKDDLNTAAAISALHNIAHINEKSKFDWSGFRAGANLLGLLEPGEMGAWLNPVRYDEQIGHRLDIVVRGWGNARAEKNYALADKIKDALNLAAVVIDRGKREIVPIDFARSLSNDERERHQFDIALFLLNPSGFVDQINAVMFERLEKLEAIK